MVGDSAHAHGGAYATGGSLAIDDAYALHLAIDHIFPPSSIVKPSVATIAAALKLYERTRKPHAEKLLNIVLKANKAKAARFGRPVTDDELYHMVAERPATAWLHEHNVVEAFEEAARSKEYIGKAAS